jgi:hypothetical protein
MQAGAVDRLAWTLPQQPRCNLAARSCASGAAQHTLDGGSYIGKCVWLQPLVPVSWLASRMHCIPSA